MFERLFFVGFGLLTSMTVLPAISNAQVLSGGQPNEAESLPRLSLPIARENYPAASFLADEEGHVVLVATIGADG